ncbi:phage tail sheath C-terminal domain-containing protein [Lacinutrix chionoecetis]
MALPPTLKTPGVYIDERNAFPNSVVGVETAIPAFIGYTEKSRYNGQSLLNKPIRVDSFMEFELFFGRGAHTTYKMDEVTTPVEDPKNYDLHINDKAYSLNAEANTRFNLYESMKFFYQNGGGSCFIISVGTYQNGVINPQLSANPFMAGIKILEKETVPTMLVIPDAVLLPVNDCYSLQVQMLNHCGAFMNRVAILDIYRGDEGLDNPTYNPIDEFRNKVSSSSLKYGAAYYPWLNTTILQAPEVSYKNLDDDSAATLKQICEDYINEALNPAQITTIKPYLDQLIGVVAPGEKEMAALVKAQKTQADLAEDASDDDKKKAQTAVDEAQTALTEAKKVPTDDEITALKEAVEKETDDNKKKEAQKTLDAATTKKEAADSILKPETINSVLNIAIPDYKLIMEAILKKKNLLPPSAAMAGIYTLVDAQRGVWKAPANVAVSSVVSPAVLIDHKQQEDLNAPILGKAICAIRPFIGLGTMVWGARTLDANSLDWKYMNVRRTVIMMEQSIKFAAKAYVFEPNVKNTWVSIQSMISNFLTNLWKQGALAGASPADAFSVNVGLGTTMTAIDILEGKMIIEVKIAVSRPAEFIVISFEQQMQKS